VPTPNWAENIKEIVDVSYVEDFWSVLTRMNTPSMMTQMGDLTFFKKGIRPMWEDQENKNGGSWLHQINTGHPNQPQQFKQHKHVDIDEFWVDSLLALIGDSFCGPNPFTPPNSSNDGGDDLVDDHVCDSIAGIYACHRAKAWKLALWTKNYKDEKTTRLIG
jgi:translation initiation factor 4E